MQGFNSILTSITTLGLAMVIGFISVKTGYLDIKIKDAIAKVIMRITLPLLMITSLTKLTLDHTKATNSIITVICSLIVIGLMYLCGRLTSHFMKLDAPKKRVQICLSTFGNVVFIAYPLIVSLFGEEGLLYAALFAFANDCWLWSAGVYTLSGGGDKNASWLDNLKKLITPSTIGFLISLIMLITGLRFGGIVKDVLTNVGSLTTYLSMLFIGMTLSMVNFKEVFKRTGFYVLIAVKMILLPALLTIILKYIPIDDIVKSVIILQVAIPASTVVVMLTTDYDCDTVYGAEGVFLSTLISLATLPLMYWFMQTIWY